MAAGKSGVTSEAPKNQSRPSHLCCYSQRICNLEKLKGFDFCHKHILEDKASPFKVCDFYAKINDKRCMNPAPKMGDKEKSYCIIHTRKAELRRVVEKRRKKRKRDNSGAIEDENEESTTQKRRRTSSCASQKSMDGSQKDDDGHSSDDDLSTDLTLKVDSAWHGDVDSDAESVDSEEEDPLRHAGTWTLDEVTKICCDKMTRLKSLYMAQYKRLFHVLKEKRRKYLQLAQTEQDNESGDKYKYVSPSEILGTTTHFKRHGAEAILHKQAKEKRHGVRHQSSFHQRCTLVSDGVRCANKILPLAKFCIHHISHDPNQLLFQSCSFKTGEDKVCSNVVPKIYSFSTCQLHMTLTADPSRPDVGKDLEEASKRDHEQKMSELLSRDVSAMSLPLLQEPDKQLPIPKALQQKSSALIPPLAPVTSTSATISTPDTTPSVATITPTKPKQFAVPNIKLEKMDVDSPALEGLPSRGSSDSTPMEVMSPASGYSTPAGIQSISPTLLAASLVAVCSAATSPSAVSALTTSSPSQSISSGLYEGITSTSTSSIPSIKVHRPGSTTIPTSMEEVKSASTLATISTEGETSSITGNKHAGIPGTISTEVNKYLATTSAPNPTEGNKSGSMSSTYSNVPSTSGSTDVVKSAVALATASIQGNKSENTSVPTSTSITSSSLASSPHTSDGKGSESKPPTEKSSITISSAMLTSNTDSKVPSNKSADPSTTTRTEEKFTTVSTPSASQSTSTSTGTINVVPVVDLTKESQPSSLSTSNALVSVTPNMQSSDGSSLGDKTTLSSETETKTPHQKH